MNHRCHPRKLAVSWIVSVWLMCVTIQSSYRDLAPAASEVGVRAGLSWMRQLSAEV